MFYMFYYWSHFPLWKYCLVEHDELCKYNEQLTHINVKKRSAPVLFMVYKLKSNQEQALESLQSEYSLKIMMSQRQAKSKTTSLKC